MLPFPGSPTKKDRTDRKTKKDRKEERKTKVLLGKPLFFAILLGLSVFAILLTSMLFKTR